MASQQSITDKSFRIAVARGVDPHNSPLIDSGEFLSEDLFRSALRQAVIEQQFQKSYALTLTDGKVALPAGVLLEQLSTANVYQEDETELCSFEERYSDFVNMPYSQISRFTVNNSQLCYAEASGDANEFDGDVTLMCVALPAIPATITDAITIPDTLADRISEILADMLIGTQ